MPQLRVEIEYGYGGDMNYQIVEFADDKEDEVVATVYGRPDIAEALLNAVHAFEVLGKM